MLPRIALRRSLTRRNPRTWRRTAKRLGASLFALRSAIEPRQGRSDWDSDRICRASPVQSGAHGEVTIHTASGPHPNHEDGRGPTEGLELAAVSWRAVRQC